MDEERRRGKDDETKVNATQKTKMKRTANANANTKKDSSTNAEPCGKCGHQAHLPGRRCPASDTVCYGCGKKGHFKAVCRGSGTKEEKKDKASVEISTVEVNTAYSKDILKIILDSGASGHVINSMNGFEEWEEDNALIRTANGEVVQSTAKGSIQIPLGNINLWVQNARFAPLNFSVISISALREKGLDTLFFHDRDAEI